MERFENRVFGCVVVKAINSNYNADFSGQPRTLPNGIVYATDKALKYTIKNYLKTINSTFNVFYFKTLNDSLNPLSLDERYKSLFGDYPKKASGKDGVKKIVASNLLSCIDVRLFGATFAGATNISLHGPVQISHGMNIWKENNIFTEQILSPFSNKSNNSDAEKGMTTNGRQSRLEEGHYMHHFSINPKTLEELYDILGEKATKLNSDDIDSLKEAMRCGVTWLDSASKIGCENEMLVWVQLKKHSKKVMPSLDTLIEMEPDKKNEKVVFDFNKFSSYLQQISEDVEKIEIYRNGLSCEVINQFDAAKVFDI
jgi:CRISPR-associated protein Csh2